MPKDSNNLLEIKVNENNKSPYELRKNLKATLKPFINKPISNTNDGRIAILPSKNIGKIGSVEAVLKSKENGFSKSEHFAVAGQIIELYKNAKLKEIQPDLKHNKDDVLIPRYEVEFILNNAKAKALITLKETLTGQYKGNRLYSLELQEITKL